MVTHVELKPITRVWESAGHECDEGLLRMALLQRQQSELLAAQRQGWVPPPARLHTLLPSFAPPAGTDEQEQKGTGTLSTATSAGVTAMDTDDDGIAASQQEQAAAMAAAAAARLLRRQQRRTQREQRRLQLLQVRLLHVVWNAQVLSQRAWLACC